jgi:hypothetical protein
MQRRHVLVKLPTFVLVVAAAVLAMELILLLYLVFK